MTSNAQTAAALLIISSGVLLLASVRKSAGQVEAGEGDLAGMIDTRALLDRLENAFNLAAQAAAPAAPADVAAANVTAFLQVLQRGIVSVTSVIGAAASSTATTFGYSYGSKIPSVNCSNQSRLVGALVIASMPRSVNASTFQSDIYTTGGANFAAAEVVSVSWSAGVCEV